MSIEQLFEQAINCWRNAKGIGTVLIPFPFDDRVLLLEILKRTYARDPTRKVEIVTSTFAARRAIISFLQEQSQDISFIKLINNEILKVNTIDFIYNRNKDYSNFVIFYRPFNICPITKDYLTNSKFNLVIINKFLSNNSMNILSNVAPKLNCFNEEDIIRVKLSSPVEEMRIGVDIPKDSEERKLLDYYDEYISTSISIFGSFDIMNQANMGNSTLNISSTQICAQIAKENGWNEHLDMNVDFNLEIDKLYNPSALKERASMTYEIIRNRNQLLSDYEGKLKAILDVINKNLDKNILIINKRGEFASKVTDYINKSLDIKVCFNYHDKVEPIPAVDVNNNPIVYKSGVKKGEQKYLAAKAQKSLAVDLFNNNVISIISTNNSPDKELNIDIDIIIITSPMCEELQSYLYRLSNVNFKSDIIYLYSIYCRNTAEEKKLEAKSLLNSNHNVKNSNEDEIISDFVVID